MSDRIQRKAEIVRCICILENKIKGTGKNNAVQIILPQNQINRESDIYIMQLGDSHKVCQKGYNLAIISTHKEKDNIEEDLKVAFELIGPYKHKFVMTETRYECKDYKDGIFVTATLDATSHFESAAEDVERIYKSLTNKNLDLSLPESK